MTKIVVWVFPVLGMCSMACAPTSGTVRTAETKEQIFLLGHRLYLEQHLDSASVVLSRALEIDSAYVQPLVDLAEIQYDLALREGSGKKRPQQLRLSRDFYARAEVSGAHDPGIY